MSLPKELVESLQSVKGFNQKTFEQVHASKQQVTSIRINPSKWSTASGQLRIPYSQFAIQSQVPWCSFGYYLEQRPSFTFDPLFHAGCYYVQEASSMFLEQALKQTVDLSKPLKVLDLCAAPGGKSTHIQSLISLESLLVSNEVIKTRTSVLKENIIKWGCGNVIVTNNDPKHFSKLEGFFDVLVIDAPCSGSGLFRKDPEAINEWSEENVMLCCGRQKRIIADAFASLKENGILIYSTCSYSKEEDEDIADWLMEELKMESLKLEIEDSWGIIETQSENKGYGYRFFPDQVKGEGFYLACFRKLTSTEKTKYKTVKLEQANTKEKEIVKNWLKPVDLTFLKTPFIYALPSVFLHEYSIIKNALNVQYAGVAVGEIMKEKLVPAHSLALSLLLKEEVPAVNLDHKEAISYLQKRELNIKTIHKGWQLVQYQSHNLGWINALESRVNNYYPKEWRILKQQDNSAFEK